MVESARDKTNVAKMVIVDGSDKYLLMYRSRHPRFGIDPDLPGGTLDDDESPLDCVLREVIEETGIGIERQLVKHLYTGSSYSENGTVYHLFLVRMPETPKVIMSWEHSSYEWLDKEEFLEKSKHANDTFMHMVHDAIKSNTSR